ncbi:putative DNA-binding transcriptional regulator YafY [Lacrimispora xylanisolvens]|uniref:Putative DNA-binding transcriptional regulator YafY n=1 Tax=Lacrimispora xylanisolvens TaxID=384636 RepID=A0A2S6HQH6_9FIRM|nr:YafY family protein [Hungatella xylanolytica]PPK79698.1 putative DNA-binding transcriptional regulator YafY [Hungatella xylanolytica]
MQINRLFEIIYLLLNKKFMTANELAEHFEVSVRTIYRDIDTLSLAGIPIYALQGKGGGISLLEHYVLDKSVLSEREQNEILYALQSMTVTQVPEADKVLAKLSSLFNKSRTNWIEVDFSPWGSDDKGYSQFTQIKDAILSHRIIEFNYFGSSGEKTARRVEPMKLIFKTNAWYLQAFCQTRNELRMFKIVRMADVQKTEETFTPMIPEPLPGGGQLQETQKWIELCFNISADGAYRVYDEFEEKEITKNTDGSFTIMTTLPESDWLIRYILSFGSEAEVKSPQHIRDMLQLELSKIAMRYKI